MLKKIEIVAQNLEEGMELAVKEFRISSEKIFLNILEEHADHLLLEALVDINLALEGKRYLETMLQNLGIEHQLEVRSLHNETEILYNIHSAENPILIGNKGRTLEAIQTLVKNLLQSFTKDRIVVTIDIGDYREVRKVQLETVATKTAKEVAKTKIPVKLKPMNAYERRIIHNKLGEWRDIFTESEGTGETRAIVIKPRKK